MMHVHVLSCMLHDIQIMQKDYALISIDSNKLHVNIIIPFFWDMTAMFF
jgi:hypothetical protein